MKQAITQWGNVGGLVAALYKDDYELLSRSLEDVIVEPIRSILIPEFSKLKQSVIASGALGCGISGSGPSIFALSKGETQARKVIETMKSVYEPLGIPFEIHCSKINETGIKIID